MDERESAKPHQKYKNAFEKLESGDRPEHTTLTVIRNVLDLALLHAAVETVRWQGNMRPK
jgi:hypothetical protein